MNPIFAADLGMASMLIAASTAFSTIGLLFLGVPFLLIIFLSVSLATPTCRAFWLFVTGSLCFAVIFFVFIVIWLDHPPSYSRFTRYQQLAIAYAAACLGAVTGILFQRLTAPKC